MPPTMFGTLDDNRHADWDSMLEARRMLEAEESDAGSDTGQMLLIAGAAIFAAIIIAMVLLAS